MTHLILQYNKEYSSFNYNTAILEKMNEKITKELGNSNNESIINSEKCI
jgi:hypothetical protein